MAVKSWLILAVLVAGSHGCSSELASKPDAGPTADTSADGDAGDFDVDGPDTGTPDFGPDFGPDFPIVSNGPGPPPPPPEVEDCSDDHDQYFQDGDGITIGVADGATEFSPASGACNQIFWHEPAGGIQGSGVFHIEPVISTKLSSEFAVVNWDVNDVEGNAITNTGIEIEPGDWVDDGDGTRSYRSIVFIGLNERGKNLRLVAHVEDGNATLTAEAALHVFATNTR